MKKAAGEGKEEKENDVALVTPVQKLVTADGTYATQSAFSAAPLATKSNSFSLFMLKSLLFNVCNVIRIDMDAIFLYLHE